MILVLPDAEMDVHRGEVAVGVEIFPVEFHVMVAATQRIGPKHVALRWIGEKPGDIVLLVQAKGESHGNVFLARDGSDIKGLRFGDVGVDVKHVFLGDLQQRSDLAVPQHVFIALLAGEGDLGDEPLDLGHQKAVAGLVDIAKAVERQRTVVGGVADLDLYVAIAYRLGAGNR